ncbi:MULTISPECIES: radical SAM protein [unclassified Methanoregula]|uniref:radical SAM protein n=1 Tax=unclassified Methanoregula TaxID=2649730 RepID=UPI0009C825A1|nr:MULTISPECIES: radical SAM protein [unclassified Methanoregula]OPX64948.1 MAG: Radical SAM superfamily protein [Methanoregula sp. PtaB.Bin085]OPY33000.1 MAG: Radical SAM superfamily protein [Methanoregula sp. PtaU1.Bin006]
MSLSQGCVLCHQGAKMVLFVTGRCHRTCWYCPLSSERKGTDTVFANERPVDIPAQIIEEAESMSALGTGITGGEPLLCLDKVTEYCRMLKEHFGPGHQIHLYTAKAPSVEELAQMQGLVDEIRLHPPPEDWKDILDSPFMVSARHAKEMGFDTGIEVPALPGLEHLIPALPFLDFLNINELEWGESNAFHMRERCYDLADPLHNAIEGARGWAEEICRHDKVHWCSSAFKDSVQLRERLKRIAGNTARPFDEITDDGTIVYGIYKPGSGSTGPIAPFFRERFEPDSYEVFPDRVETAWWLLEKYADELDGKKLVIERYPNNGMIVEVTPL